LLNKSAGGTACCYALAITVVSTI